MDESFDPNTIVLVKAIKVTDEYAGDKCYELVVSALKEDMEYNKKIAIPDWRQNGVANYTIYDAPYHKSCFDADSNFNDII